MDPDASTSALPLDSTNKIRDIKMEENAKKEDSLKEFEDQKAVTNVKKGEEENAIIKKKVSILSVKSRSKKEDEKTEECNNDDDGSKMIDPTKIDEQNPTTSKTSKLIKKEKFSRSKKLSVEETQRPFDSTKITSKRRRSSIPDFSQEESAGTNPALFIWHKEAFKNSPDQEEEYLTSDLIESEVEDTDSPPPSNMVVSESTIMFLHPESSGNISNENTHEHVSQKPDKEEFHLSEPVEDLIDDAFDDSEIFENDFNVIVEEVDLKTGNTIDTPRSSDSGSDHFLSPDTEVLQEFTAENVSSSEIKEPPTIKLSNAFLEEALKVILEESKNEMPNIITNNEPLSTTSSPTSENIKTILEKDCIETVNEESFGKPPRPPSRAKKLSIHSSEIQQPTTSSDFVQENTTLISEPDNNLPSSCSTESFEPSLIVEPILLNELQEPPLTPTSSSIPLPPPLPPKLSKSLKSDTAIENIPSNTNELCLPRIFQTLTIFPQQFRPLPEDILQTIAVGGNPSRVFSEKATIEIKRPYQYVKLIFIEHTENSETRQIGKLSLRKKDILPISGKDVVLPVQGSPLTRSTVSTILGEICLNMESKSENIVKLG
uniref:Uncharacterized protein n=1 Tax=Panagrolaimus davidi TaxID=227884 RepID=A0A914NYP9_9BILA